MKSRTANILLLIMLIPTLCLSQVEKWVFIRNGNIDSFDDAFAIAYGLDGNIYAAGRVANWGASSDFVVVSIDANGGTNWIYEYNNFEDVALSVVYGLDSNIYAAGISGALYTYWDFFVLSLTTDGDTNWTYRHDGPSTEEDYDIAFTLTYGLDGNIYVGGRSKDISTAGDFFVVSLKTTGETNWTHRYGGTVYSGGAAKSIVYGADSNIYVAGHSFNIGTRRDFVVLSLSTDGDTNWTYRYDGAFNTDEATSVTYGLDGNIYAAGYSTWIDSLRYFTVISLTDEGDENWVFRYPGGVIDAFNAPYAVVYGMDNNIYAAGKSSLPGQSDDFFVVSLSTDGDTNWTYQLNGSAEGNDWAVAIAYGSDGNIYATGMVNNTGSAQDFTVVSLDCSGIANWIYYYAAEVSYPLWDGAYAITYGLDGDVYAAGFGCFDETAYDFTVIGLDPATGIEENSDLAAGSIRLDVVPNPCTDRAVIRYSILDARYSIDDPTIKIYDATGRLVKSLNLESNIGNQESVVSWDGTDAGGNRLPGGVYFVRLMDGEYMAVEKLLLVR